MQGSAGIAPGLAAADLAQTLDDTPCVADMLLGQRCFTVIEEFGHRPHERSRRLHELGSLRSAYPSWGLFRSASDYQCCGRVPPTSRSRNDGMFLEALEKMASRISAAAASAVQTTVALMWPNSSQSPSSSQRCERLMMALAARSSCFQKNTWVPIMSSSLSQLQSFSKKLSWFFTASATASRTASMYWSISSSVISGFEKLPVGMSQASSPGNQVQPGEGVAERSLRRLPAPGIAVAASSSARKIATALVPEYSAGPSAAQAPTV